MYQIRLNPRDKTPKYRQIIQAVVADIERQYLRPNDQLPSISEMSAEYDLARDTVEKAYRELRERGYLTSVQGKGFYVIENSRARRRILLIFNKLSSYKKIIYYAFLEALQGQARVDLQIHHYNARLFEEIVESSLGHYNHYVVMPHFFYETDTVDVQEVLQKIPKGELLFLDKNLPGFSINTPAVFQDFERDIYEALVSLRPRLQRYGLLTLIFPSDGNYPPEIVKGFRLYCLAHSMPYRLCENALDEPIEPGTAYVVVEETDLAELIKKARQVGLVPGHEVGLISFNETTLKELLGITVVTTDFAAMGRTAAHLLQTGRCETIKNPFFVIERGSV